MSQQVLRDIEQRMTGAENALSKALGSIRAGRANASLLEGIQVLYYGAPTPLNQLAQISVPEARMLTITPFDKSALQDIEKAINKSDIGITPSSDGNMIRLVIPQLTEERRRDIAKLVGEEAENGKVAVRNIRRDGIDEFRDLEKSGDISEDELRRYEKDVQALTDQSVKNIDALAAEKEREILED